MNVRPVNTRVCGAVICIPPFNEKCTTFILELVKAGRIQGMNFPLILTFLYQLKTKSGTIQGKQDSYLVGATCLLDKE